MNGISGKQMLDLENAFIRNLKKKTTAKIKKNLRIAHATDKNTSFP